MIEPEPFSGCLVGSLFPSGLDDVLYEIDAQRLAEEALVRVLPDWLAAVLFDHSPPTSAGGELIVDAPEDQEADKCNEQYMKRWSTG